MQSNTAPRQPAPQPNQAGPAEQPGESGQPEEAGALESVRAVLLDEKSLVRAVGSGRRRGAEAPAYQRVELRYVDLKGGRLLQVTEYDDRQAHTRNVPAEDKETQQAVNELLGAAYGNWHLETTTETLRLRYTKKGKLLLHRQ